MRGLLRPTLNMPNPPSRSRYRLPSESQRNAPSALAQRRSKPIVRSSRTNCGLIVCAWRSSASAPRSSTSSVSQPTGELSPCADERAAGDDQCRAGHEPPTDELTPAQQQRGEEHAPERLGRNERRDHGYSPPVVRLEESRVGEAEQHAGREEGTDGDSVASSPAAAAGRDEVER